MIYNLLIVESDEIKKKTLHKFFRKETRYFDTTIASSIPEAMDIMETSNFDVVASSIVPDGGTAIDLFATAGNAPVIVVGDPGDESDIAECFKIGAKGYILRDPENNYLKLLFVVARTLAERKNEEEYARILYHVVMAINDSVAVSSPKGGIKIVNPAFLKLYKYNEKDIIGKNIKDLWRSTDELREAPRNNKGEFYGETNHVRADGSSLKVFLNSVILEKPGGDKDAVIFVIKEIKEEGITGENRIQNSEASEFYERIFRISDVGTFRASPDGKLIYCNPALAKILDFEDPEHLLGATGITKKLFVESDTRAKFMALLYQRGFVNNFEFKIMKKNGGMAWVEGSAHAVKDAEGKIICFDGFVRDITEKKIMEEETRDLSIIDSLTGLLTKEGFLETLSNNCYSSHRYNYPLAIFLCRLDKLHYLQEVHGSASIDEITAKIGAVIRDELRLSDFAGQFSQHVIVVALPQTETERALFCAERIRSRIESLTFKSKTTGKVFKITVSLGVAELNADANEEVLLTNADNALKEASLAGNRIAAAEIVTELSK